MPPDSSCQTCLSRLFISIKVFHSDMSISMKVYHARHQGPSMSIKKPVVVLCIGMAGSGKTTFMQCLNADLQAADAAPYVINLDPAVLELPYEANIDIRDTVDY